MKKLHRRFAFLGVFFIFTVLLGVPEFADAQYSGRRIPSSYRSKINKLDDDVVKNLPIPILFGITLQTISPNFGDPRSGGARSHEGLDILAPKGAPIVSPTEAVVVRTGSGSSSGKYVTTANPGGETFVYMHLSEILVQNGDELDVGDLIGLVGNTGNASGGPAHLHFEVREGRRAMDPFPRITLDFPLQEKIKYLDEAIDDAEDENEFVKFIVENYKTYLWQAKGLAIALPIEIEKKLQTVAMPVVSTGTVAVANPGDLTVGSEGPLVSLVQGFLIGKNTGPSASALSKVGATGYFGPLTEKALIEYQIAHGITPATGYFGPKTREYILKME